MTGHELIVILLAAAAFMHFGSILILLFRSFAAVPDPGGRPPVTILRPVRGIENHIEETLTSAFRINYPEFEIVHCVADADDSIVPVVKALMRSNPEVPSRLLIGDDRISINPKLNNIVKGWRAAKHDWVIMTDSNVLVPRDYIDQLLGRWRMDTGLVCSPPVGTQPESIGAELECAFLNSHQARWQLCADSVGIGFAQGKSMLWRKEDLDQAGGIAALASEPAEDAASTKIVHHAGKRVRLVIRPFPQPLGRRPFREVWQRQLRWARLRRVTFPPLYSLEALAGGLVPLTLAALLAALGVIPWVAFFTLFVGWYGAELLLCHRFGWPVSFRIAGFLVARDLLLPALWVGGWTGDTFVWRGNAMDIGGDGNLRDGRPRAANGNPRPSGA